MDERQNHALSQLLFDIDRMQDHMERKNALAWLVVCIDDEAVQKGDVNCVVATYGPFASPEDALVEAGKHDATGLRMNADEPIGWSHLIRPLYAPVDRKD